MGEEVSEEEEVDLVEVEEGVWRLFLLARTMGLGNEFIAIVTTAFVQIYLLKFPIQL